MTDTLDALSLSLLNQAEQQEVCDLFNACLLSCRCDVFSVSHEPTKDTAKAIMQALGSHVAYVVFEETVFYINCTSKKETFEKLERKQGIKKEQYQAFIQAMQAHCIAGGRIPLAQVSLEVVTATTGHVHERRPASWLDQKSAGEQKQWLDRLGSPILLDYFETLIDQLASDARRGMFRYYTHVQRRAYEEELLLAFRLLTALCVLDEKTEQRLSFERRKQQLIDCAFIIDELRWSAIPTTPAKEHERMILTMSPEKPVAYCGLRWLGPFIADKIHEFSLAKASTIIDWMSDVNMRRLYWIWGGGLVGAVIEALSEDTINQNQAREALNMPTPITGYMSWVLYYTRFSINLALLLKHTFKGPWMSQAEKDLPISTWERFTTQWEFRKFSLLNDSVWATANLACFFWLIGTGMMGYGGNVLTAGLLLMDLCLTAWGFCEERTTHRKNMERYKAETEELNKKIAQHKHGSEQRIAGMRTKLQDLERLNAESEDNVDEQIQTLSLAIVNDEKEVDTQEHVLALQLDALKKAEAQARFDWKHKKYRLTNDLAYAVGLLVSFIVVCCFFFPPAAMAPGIALALGVAGAALCFLSSLLYAAVGGALDVEKERQTKALMQPRFEASLMAFKAARATFNAAQTPDERQPYESEMRQHYLDMKRLLATSEHQERLVRFQKMKLVRTVLLDAMIPALVFVTLALLPTGIGLPILAAGIVLAMLTHVLLKRFEPKADQLPGLNEDAYQAFAADPRIETLQHEKKSEPRMEPLVTDRVVDTGTPSSHLSACAGNASSQ